MAAGAIAVVGDGVGIPGATVVQVAEPRRALARAASRFHGDPSRALQVVAVTGTNGKTTTTYMLESILRAASLVPGIIGTTGVHLGDERRASSLTTPESLELQALLAEMRDRGVRAVAFEMSSHALVQRRGFGVHCDAAVFTNLTHDHLDYHGTMEAYLDAKRMLFDGRNAPEPVKPCAAVINSADPVAREIEESARRGGMRTLWYRGEPGAPEAEQATQVTALAPDAEGLDLELKLEGEPWSAAALGPAGARTLRMRLPLLGRYNAANAAAACTAAGVLGIAPETIVRGLEQMAGVQGLDRGRRGTALPGRGGLRALAGCAGARARRRARARPRTRAAGVRLRRGSRPRQAPGDGTRGGPRGRTACGSPTTIHVARTPPRSHATSRPAWARSRAAWSSIDVWRSVRRSTPRVPTTWC